MESEQITPITLTIDDIGNAVKIIDHAVELGAFRGLQNIRQVITIRDCLDAFAIAASAQPPGEAGLTVTNIADVVKIIDHAGAQDVFKGWQDIRQIIAVRDRFDVFVIAATAQANANQKINIASPVLD